MKRKPGTRVGGRGNVREEFKEVEWTRKKKGGGKGEREWQSRSKKEVRERGNHEIRRRKKEETIKRE